MNNLVLSIRVSPEDEYLLHSRTWYFCNGYARADVWAKLMTHSSECAIAS